MAAEDKLARLGARLRGQTEGSAEREAMLEKLAAEIRSGRYRVDLEELADKLIGELEKNNNRAEND